MQLGEIAEVGPRYRRVVVGVVVVIGLLIGGTPMAPPAAAATCEPAVPGATCVEYGSHPRQVMDVFAPTQPATTPRPAVLFIHGGGWTSGDKAQFAAAAHDVTQLGWVGFSMNYRLAGDGTDAPYLDQPADVEAAVAWIRTNAAALGIDPDRIAIVGASAGAHLAMMHATRSTTQPVRSVVSFAGPTDLRLLALLPTVSTFVSNYVGQCSFLACSERYASGSPVTQIGPATPPMFLAQGVLDLFVPVTQAHQMASALRANGVPAEVKTCLCTHGSVLGQWTAAKVFLLRHLA